MGGMPLPLYYCPNARRTLRPLLHNKTDEEKLLAIK
jgi:hypothetical protein